MPTHKFILRISIPRLHTLVESRKHLRQDQRLLIVLLKIRKLVRCFQPLPVFCRSCSGITYWILATKCQIDPGVRADRSTDFTDTVAWAFLCVCVCVWGRKEGSATRAGGINLPKILLAPSGRLHTKAFPHTRTLSTTLLRRTAIRYFFA